MTVINSHFLAAWNIIDRKEKCANLLFSEGAARNVWHLQPFSPTEDMRLGILLPGMVLCLHRGCLPCHHLALPTYCCSSVTYAHVHCTYTGASHPLGGEVTRQYSCLPSRTISCWSFLSKKCYFKGSVQWKLAGVESGINWKVFLSHWTADIFIFILRELAL